MTRTSTHPSPSGLTLDHLKLQARHLRTSLAASGTDISHSRSLELMAHQHGYKNWNVLYAAIGNQPPATAFQLGDAVTGRYLGQDFTGEIVGASLLARDRYQLSVHFDEPVDVVTFDSFSSFRRRVRCTVDASGMSAEKTSDGRPHMQIRVR